MRFAVDIMGGDNAPQEIVKGTLEAAAKNPNNEYIMVGNEEVLNSISDMPQNVSVRYSQSVMGMDETVENLIAKKDSSIWVATRLVKDGEADAVISAGSTGAQMAAATLLLGRIKGITRPAIAGIVPAPDRKKLFLDMGANVSCTPEMLFQFAVMGSVYVHELWHIENPAIALLSNGTEDHKGTETVVAANALLRSSDLNFIGNREGRDIVSGDYDVLVCDGFSGNIALKTIEGTASALFKLIKEELMSSVKMKMGAALVKPGLKEIKKYLDPNEQGGAPLVGVKGISIICHGSSKAAAIVNAFDTAAVCIECSFVEKISAAINAAKAE